jgi:hypothetical protein
MVPFKNVYAPYAEDAPYRCPCCRYPTLHDRGGYAICPVCWWEDDGQDDHDADEVRGGPNELLSLSQARRNFEAIGCILRDGVGSCRPPTQDEALNRFPDTPTATVLMPLMNEGATVWAPVAADPQGRGRYRVLGPMPDDQEWQFGPGEIVSVGLRSFADGSEALTVIG